MRIYFAGPLFNLAEIDFNNQMTKRLRDVGYEVWLPQESEFQKTIPREIFLEDKSGIDWCDILLGNMDGEDPDSGTCWEVGYAYGIGKKIVLYRTDFRNTPKMNGHENPYNLMLWACANEHIVRPFISQEQLLELIIDHLGKLPHC